MKKTNLCFLIEGDRVLLGLKKRGFGSGKWNGFGGKLKEGEDAKSALVRELKEEAGVDVAIEDLQEVGKIQFRFQNMPDWENDCAVFIANSWTGDPVETEEMKPEWYSKNALPFEKMWIDDPRWLPLVLTGKKINAKFYFDDSGSEIINFAVSEIKE